MSFESNWDAQRIIREQCGSLTNGDANSSDGHGRQQRSGRDFRGQTRRHGAHRRRPHPEHRDINEITTVIKGGKVYDPAAIERALGIAPRLALK
jgi:hypothetical protein